MLKLTGSSISRTRPGERGREKEIKVIVLLLADTGTSCSQTHHGHHIKLCILARSHPKGCLLKFTYHLQVKQFFFFLKVRVHTTHTHTHTHTFSCVNMEVCWIGDMKFISIQPSIYRFVLSTRFTYTYCGAVGNF